MKLIVTLSFVLIAWTSVAVSGDVNKASLYQVDSVWRNQNDEQLTLSDLQGQVQLVAFVYTFCEHTCPLIVSQIESVLGTVSEDLQNDVHVTLITLAPERDTPAKLKAYMAKRKLDENQWTMLTGDAADVRVLANLFDVKYQPMRKDQLAHSNLVTLLDQQGVMQYQLRGLDADQNEMVNWIERLAHRS